MLVEESPDFYRVLTGSGVRYDVVCGECVGRPLLTVCEGCAERAEDWGESLGWGGTPEIRHEDRFVAGTVRAESWDVRPLNERCLAPLPHGWLALTESGLVDQAGFVRAVELEVDQVEPAPAPEARARTPHVGGRPLCRRVRGPRVSGRCRRPGN
ncbi:hypothetical protein SK571_31280 [Lentzea sp. BCCO 10_0798]|uniref:DUF35 domain-containing protein n=1 Tax=Lentzea kristufekii TaxID=3095430 RepID=A0ABU4TZX3_9PSEU|nr:hypothetical protein [Lentzea sp. BCCO 10_0798]MDX8053875.1 hypothetical protein [Lentzea sp. BCCO 10_0798]